MSAEDTLAIKMSAGDSFNNQECLQKTHSQLKCLQETALTIRNVCRRHTRQLKCLQETALTIRNVCRRHTRNEMSAGDSFINQECLQKTHSKLKCLQETALTIRNVCRRHTRN
ncbi:hypothetical protein BgiBS90_014992 [Biomphalaria glabrata]|nr:hypothetical protein BgiBS90_014992 [Biomphalaria glabrata]